jgi:carbamoyl-phosphate synthase large subunit
VYARERERFAERGTLVAVSSPDVVAIAADKRSTHQFLQQAGLPTVRQADLADVLADSDAWTFPCIAKPARGSAAIGVMQIDNVAQLQAFPVEGSVVQAIAAGDEYTVDVFVDRDGVCRCAVPRQRIEVRGGEVTKARTVRNTRVEELARSVCAALPGAFGVLNIQIFDDPSTGDLNVIEVNPRFGGGYPLTEASGASFTRALVQVALGEEPDLDPRSWHADVTMLRYDDALFVTDDSAR